MVNDDEWREELKVILLWSLRGIALGLLALIYVMSQTGVTPELAP